MTGASPPTLPTIALALVSLSAGFLAASVSTDGTAVEPAARLGPGGEAFAVDVRAGETLRVTAPETAGTLPVAVYGPDDALHAYEPLGPDEAVEATAEDAGTWVVMPLAAEAPVEVGFAGADEPAGTDRVTPLPVRAHERPVHEVGQAQLNETTLVSLDRRPALVGLRAEGQARNLTLELRSDAGPVFEAEAAALDGTLGLEAAPEAATLTPANIRDGLYQLAGSADAFEGQVSLVHRTYDRTPDRDSDANTSLEGIASMGVPVAGLEGGEAVHVDTDGIDRLRFVVGDGSAKARLYGPDDGVHAIVELAPRVGYNWGFPEDQSPLVATTVSTPRDDVYTVYAVGLDDVDRLNVLAPGERTAPLGEPAPIEETRVSLGGGAATTTQTHEVETSVRGGLVHVSADVQASAARGHEVSVTGPQGTIFLYEASASAEGEPVDERVQRSPHHYSDGDFVVRVHEEYAVDGGVEVVLSSYRPT